MREKWRFFWSRKVSTIADPRNTIQYFAILEDISLKRDMMKV
jgi:hypothetical protein